jgi:glycosyltransferase involved in cell wall biosynthesis
VPGALLEALDHGLPVIASDVGGVSDVVRHEQNGLLVPPADAASLAAAIGQLADRKLRAALGREARKNGGDVPLERARAAHRGAARRRLRSAGC